MAEIISRQNPGEESLGNFLRLLADGGTDQQRLAAEGAAAVGYLSQAEQPLSPDIQGLVDDTTRVILRMMTEKDQRVRQTGMELAWSQYVGSRAARNAKELTLDVLFE